MCGICGVLRFSESSIVSKEILNAMTAAIHHRGPDDGGQFIEGPVGFGHRRLSIIDLSPLGKQPMFNDDRSIWLTFNGEIYNFRELREELIQKGHRFRSQTDSEVVIRGYEEWGIESLKKLNGMFAIGIWDAKEKSLFLARDRLGIKPLFYQVDEEGLRFASEIKGILADPSVERILDIEAVSHFLSLNYMPAPLTGFSGISQLLPAHYLKVKNGRIETKSYWDLSFSGEIKKSDQDYKREFDERLRTSVKMQLMSDVPFGAFLSGGLDSSSIVSYMTEILDRPVKTFSIGFTEKSYNETSYARQVAKHLGTEHFEEIVKPNIVDLLPKMVWHAEEPTGDSSMLPVYVLSELTRKHVTMALSGDGADEILAGYPTYQAHYLARFYRGLPRPFRGALDAFVKNLPVSHEKLSFDYKAKAFINGAKLSAEASHYSWREIFSEAEKQSLFDPAFQLPDPTADLYAKYLKDSKAKDFLNRMLEADTRFYLPNDMLTKVDRMSMAHSLEVRVPFLDHELVEFVASLPPHLKLNRFFRKKFILKEVMKNKLPHQILNRKKAGFNVPISKWISEDLFSFTRDLLSESRIRQMGLFQPAAIQKLITEHSLGIKDNGYKLWSLLILFIWIDLFKVNIAARDIARLKVS